MYNTTTITTTKKKEIIEMNEIHNTDAYEKIAITIAFI